MYVQKKDYMGPISRVFNLSLLLIATLLVFPMTSSLGQIADYNPEELEKIDVIEHPGEQIPLDLVFQNDTGQTVKLGDYFNSDKPVILIIAYYECPMLCTLVLNGISDGIRNLGWSPGDEFQMITVSIDPRETPDLAAGWQEQRTRSIHTIPYLLLSLSLITLVYVFLLSRVTTKILKESKA